MTRVQVFMDGEKTRRVFLRFADVDASQRASRVLDAVQREAPQGKTGNLRRMLTKSQSRDILGRWATGYDVTSNAPYSIFVIKGTRPHPIVGNPLLAFFWPKVGANVVFRHVMHPGTKPNDFLTRALRAAR